MLDLPNSRSSHSFPVPRGGGLSFFLLSFLFSVVALFLGQASSLVYLPLLLFPLSIIGLFDDKYNLPAFFRFTIQLCTAFLIIFFSPLAQIIFFSSTFLFINILF